MTSLTKKFIEFQDVIGIQIECKKCGISLLVSGDTLRSMADQHSDALYECPTCHTGWTVKRDGAPVQMAYDTEVKKFIRMLDQMRAIEENLGCRLRFEIKDDDY
jgi:hypothetical protein